ncbi:uncharacterized protein LOC133190609 [Saccostrea echinata]|uniref:uncharacterized protein LOC133190609 n=1 Tax=Saccostrea echinata TaxID=191078 RepID=UPI002A7F0931|nr:uncharacterized protein LOC133190609 [Saccostrea echinata]
MGLFVSKLTNLFESFSSGSRARIIMLGLDNAGKTTILYKLKLNEKISDIPTIGFNVETLSPVKGVTFTVFDVGGQDRLRSLWRHYYQGSEGLVYVVDSNDKEKIAESSKELFGILQDDEMKGVPVVIIANKKDLPNAVSTSEMAEMMRLHRLTTRKWFIQAACAITGEGIYESMKELSTMVKDFKKENSDIWSMGLLLSKLTILLESFSFRSPAKILILGLDAAGKPAIFYRLNLRDNQTTIPTMGFDVGTVSPVKGVSFTVWDLGGRDRMRSLWKYYYQNTHVSVLGLVYVVDSGYRDRITESREELFNVLQNEEMTGVPVMIIANKQDLSNPLGTSEIADMMCLHILTPRKWSIRSACATTGEGIFDAMQELATMIKEYKRERVKQVK